ncbi:MAG: DUF4249 domain-containing protein [Adhaeribacter sp.]
MKAKYFSIYLLLCCSVITACKERFEPNLPNQANSYLVVEGLINTGPGETRIKLTRTNPLTAANNNLVAELKAQVQVEGANNAYYPLSENGEGYYVATNLNLPATTLYRLRIKTTSGKEYLSEFVPVKQTPAIDNIHWEENNNGVQLYINTHDNQNNTRYYLWNYEETWEYLSQEQTNLKWDGSKVVTRTPAEQIYRCWGQGASTNLLLGSSAKLSQDIIYHQPLTFISQGSIKLSHKYSILVRQYALTREAYDFLQTMRKNTETMGSFFDPQPSELKGNIRCVTNPNEPVIGFVGLCNVVEKRIFISRTELNNWQDQPYNCQYHLVINHPDTLKWYFEGIPPVPYPQYYVQINPLPSDGVFVDQTKPCCIYIPLNVQGGGWYAVADYCADCTVRGGKTVKPDFWP